jgi:hypothetical protein
MYAVSDVGGGGIAPTRTITATAATDPQVAEAVDRTLEATRFGQPGDGAQAAYQVADTMTRTDLSEEQKDAYIAEITRLAGSGIGATRCIDSRTSEKLLKGLDDIGQAWTGPATPALRDQVEAAVWRGVAEGRLGADQLYALVKEPGSHGARQLLSEVRDGVALSQVAQRLTADARAQGYDIDAYQTGPQTLVAAADVATMAARNGSRAGANTVLAEIARNGDRPVAGETMTLTDAMMATTVGGGQWNTLYERDGFHALSGLLNAATPDARNRPALDSLFASLVRSGGEGFVGGIDEGGDRGGALDQLGRYFNANVGRLAETDWRKANTGDLHHGLVRDFMRHVMLDPSYGDVGATQEALASVLSGLATRIDDTGASADARLTAATTMGAVMGSLEQAGADYIAQAKGDAEAKVALVRQFTDVVTDKFVGKLKAQLPEVAQDGAGSAAGSVVDAMWQRLVDWQASAASGHVDETTGGLVDLTRAIRDSISGLDAAYLNGFDTREDLYHDD